MVCWNKERVKKTDICMKNVWMCTVKDYYDVKELKENLRWGWGVKIDMLSGKE